MGFTGGVSSWWEPEVEFLGTLGFFFDFCVTLSDSSSANLFLSFSIYNLDSSSDSGSTSGSSASSNLLSSVVTCCSLTRIFFLTFGFLISGLQITDYASAFSHSGLRIFLTEIEFTIIYIYIYIYIYILGRFKKIFFFEMLNLKPFKW